MHRITDKGLLMRLEEKCLLMTLLEVQCSKSLVKDY